MSDAEEVSGAKWKPAVEEAVELAEQFPERYRTEIFKAVLNYRLGGTPQPQAAPGKFPSSSSQPPMTGGIAAVAEAAGVSSDALQRILEFDEDNEGVQILVPRLGGETISERQNRFSALYCFAREKAFGQTKTDIEKLRDLCDARGCYDSNNFTRNFRNQDLLREVPGDEGEGRKYILSEKGVERAKQIIQNIVTQ